LSSEVYSNSVVAKVQFVKGRVKLIKENAKIFKYLRRNDEIENKSTIITEEKSVVRIKYTSNSVVTLAPKSRIVILKQKTQKAGLINLIKGQLRSKVLGNKNQETKLYIKTKSAAMGVRGTEFHVIYNDQASKTSLLTYSGSVKMVSDKSDFNYNTIEEKLNTQLAVDVGTGQVSFAEKNTDKVSLPTRISPAQFNVLKNNINFQSPKKLINKRSEQKVPPPIPRGMDPKFFSNSVLKERKSEEFISPIGPDQIAEGRIDQGTGQVAPTAGGFIDLNTGAYIPPNPRNSIYDENTNSYIPRGEMGGFNNETGEYQPPPGKEISSDGANLMDKNSGKMVSQFDMNNISKNIQNNYQNTLPGHHDGPGHEQGPPGAPPGFNPNGPLGEGPGFADNQFEDFENDNINEGQDPPPPPPEGNISVVNITITI
jgi:hypothetical protein